MSDQAPRYRAQTWQEIDAEMHAEARAEYRAATARGDYNSEADEDWAAQEAENREARAAATARNEGTE